MDMTLSAVQPGDYVEVNGGGVVRQIVNVWPNAAVYPQTCTTVELAPVLVTTGNSSAKGSPTITLSSVNNISLGGLLDLEFGTPNAETVQVIKITNNVVTVTSLNNAGTYSAHPPLPLTGPYPVQTHGIASFGPGTTYRIIRAPRVTGDELLEMPNNIVIDLQTNLAYGNTVPLPSTGGNLDIMFAPSGAVTVRGGTGTSFTQGVPQDYLALWVRDLNAGPSVNGVAEFQLSPTLIAVYTRTGFVAAHPPTIAPTSFPPPAGYNPYQFLSDGRPQ